MLEVDIGGARRSHACRVAAALEGASDLGHTYLGCEHLVLGLADQAEGAARELLGDLGIKPDRVRRAIPAAVGAATLGYTHAHEMLGPVAALPGNRFPNMVAVADHYAIIDQDLRFELLLDLFVEGLARNARGEAP